MTQTTMGSDASARTTSISVINRDAALAQDAVAALNALQLREWHRMLAARPEWMTLSTLRDLLALAHDDLDRDPRRSARIAKFVLEVLPCIAVPHDAWLVAQKIQGTAWKEYGNALRISGQHRRALTAANRAIALFSSQALPVERAAATILKAHTLHDLGRSEEALGLLDAAASIFAAAGEERRHLQTLILRGIIVFENKEYAVANTTFERAFVIAQRLNDPRELARLYNNRGHCALHLGDLVAAWDLLVEAAARFTEQNMDAELPRAHWGLARLMRTHETPAETVAVLQRIYAAFSQRGMAVAAASALLEIATTLAGEPAYHEQVRTMCSQLAELFAHTRMPPDAIAALGQLRKEALADTEFLGSGITQVRNYFRQLRVQAGPLVLGH